MIYIAFFIASLFTSQEKLIYSVDLVEVNGEMKLKFHDESNRLTKSQVIGIYQEGICEDELKIRRLK